MCVCVLLSLQGWIEFSGYRLSDAHRYNTHTLTYTHLFVLVNLTKLDSSISMCRLSGSCAIVSFFLPLWPNVYGYIYYTVCQK